MRSVSLLLLTFICTIVQCALTNEQLLKTVQNSKHKLLTLNDENYESILKGPRDYHVVALLTSQSPQINCVLCHQITPELEIVADSWVKDHPKGIKIEQEEEEGESNKKIVAKNIYFFKSEFAESKKLFSLFELNTIPKIFHFKPTKAPGPKNFLHEKQEYQFFQGDHKSLMLNWVQDVTGQKINLYVPIDNTKLIIHAIIGFVSVFLLKRYRTYVGKALTSKLSWCIVSLITVLLFTTGYMFNQIRGSPYVLEHADGKTDYFAPGQQTQFGIETQIMSFLYGILSILVIILIKRAPEIKNDSISLILVSVVSLLIFVLFSLVLSIFGLKGMGFPYRFIRFF
ncbi:OST3 [Candida margitis]|uniref:OST3 n=1 Tax=Candida margitis TaxID=1775924 RepID=UPI002226BE66|nr:OST3 [Candida margitis]KAI5969771.1 OST3 [Candida margitis]